LVKAAERTSGLTPEKIRASMTDRQLKQVLRILGYPDAKRVDLPRAFYALAEVCLELGHVRYSPRRKKRGAAKWDKAETVFLGMMIELRNKGLSERRAIHEIAANPKMWRHLPYKQQRSSLYGGKIERANREAALRQNWNRMKKKWGKNPLESVLCPQEWPASPLHRKFMELELGPLIGTSRGDKQRR
jgi:hypothetical protein